MAFQLGGFTNILRVWLSQDEPESPTEIKKIMIGAIQQLADSIK